MSFSTHWGRHTSDRFAPLQRSASRVSIAQPREKRRLRTLVSPEGVCEVEMAVALEDEPQAGNVALRIVDRRSQTAVENHVVVDLNQTQAKSVRREGNEKFKRNI